MSSYQLTWVPHFGGHLALGHKPGKRLRTQLAATRCTLVVNLLSERESRAEPRSGRIRLPLATARPPGTDRDIEVRSLFRTMDAELVRGGKVFVHCSAGLHRTGMIAYAYFRYRGLNVENTRAVIRELREATESELTNERCAWGERYARAISKKP